jgi:hypothetical protein
LCVVVWYIAMNNSTRLATIVDQLSPSNAKTHTNFPLTPRCLWDCHSRYRPLYLYLYCVQSRDLHPSRHYTTGPCVILFIFLFQRGFLQKKNCSVKKLLFSVSLTKHLNLSCFRTKVLFASLHIWGPDWLLLKRVILNSQAPSILKDSVAIWLSNFFHLATFCKNLPPPQWFALCIYYARHKESNGWGIFKEWNKQDQLGSYWTGNLWELD